METIVSADRPAGRGLARLLRWRPLDLSTEGGRASERHRRVALSVAASALSKVIGLLVTLVSIPLTLSYLGAERFGVWSTLSSLIITLQFIDLGIGNGLVNAVSEAHGRGDRAAIRRYFSSAVLALTGVAVLVLMLAPVLVTQVPWADLMKLSEPLARQEVSASVAAFLCCIALGIPLALVQRVQVGLQQGFVASLWQCVSNLVSLVAIWLATRLELGLPWLVVALLGAPLLTALLNAMSFLAGASRDLRPGLRYVTRPAVKELLSTGVAFLVLQIAVAGVLYSDTFIIAYKLGAAMVAEYAVPERLFSIVSVLLATAMGPLWPAYREAIVRGDLPWVTRTLRRSLALAVGLSFLASLFLVLAGPWLMMHWVGAAVPANGPLLMMLGLWKILESAGLALAMFLNGAGVLRLQVVTATMMLVATLMVKPWMVGEHGIVGAPMTTAIIYFAITLVPLAFVIRRILRDIRAAQPAAAASGLPSGGGAA
jgi:O-antigen/teichoic acid export membrane protein